MDSKEAREQEILNLVTDVKGIKWNVTSSENYTSAEIGLKLQRSLTIVGLLPNESEEIPKTLFVNESAQKLYLDIGCVNHLAGKDAYFFAIFWISRKCGGNTTVWNQ